MSELVRLVTFTTEAGFVFLIIACLMLVEIAVSRVSRYFSRKAVEAVCATSSIVAHHFPSRGWSLLRWLWRMNIDIIL